MRTMFTLIILGLAVIGTGTTAFAQPATVSQTPFNVVMPSCNGEQVALAGTVHTVTQITNDSSGLHLNIRFNWSGVKGTGLTTLAQYVGTGTSGISINSNTPATELTVLNNFNVISQGASPNLAVSTLTHVTVNADGTVAVSFDRDATTCSSGS